MSMKNKFNKVLSDFSNEEKVFLYNFLYEDLSGKGVCGDTELAHVNKHEMDVLRSMGGVGTINENTKCVQFFGSPPPPPPVQTTSVQTKEIPEELKPYVKEVLSEAQDIYKTRKGEGYVPFTGQEIADFTTEQERAFDLTSDVVGQTQAFATPAAQFAGLAGLGTTDADISRFMNPYASQVIDIAERERRRAGDIEAQELAAQSVAAGAFGGSRQGILEAERRRNLEQGIADIRTAGLGQAFKQAVEQAQAQQESRLGAARSLTELAQVAPRGTADELARLEAVGAARRGQSQAELDIAQRKFLEERTFPEATLQQYSQFIQPTQGALGAAGTTTNRGPGQAQPTYLQQTAGLIGALGSAAGGFAKMSDPREKTDIQKIGMDDATGLAMYSFRYKDDPKTYPKVVGPMSDEVKEKYPELVSEVDGTEVVDFGGLASIANMNKEENVASLRQGGLVSLSTGKQVKDKEEEEGFFSFLTKPTEIDPEQSLQGPSRLDTISDYLLKYSQTDPSKPLGTQLGQTFNEVSKAKAATKQQRLANDLAIRRVEAEEKALDIKSAKVLDIPISTANSLRDALIKVSKGAGVIQDSEKNIVIKATEDAIKGKQGRNVDLIKLMLKRFKTPAGEGDPEKKSDPRKVVVSPSPEQPTIMSKQKAAYGT